MPTAPAPSRSLLFLLVALTALGDDPSDWPTADPALLPPAATLSAQPSHTRP